MQLDIMYLFNSNFFLSCTGATTVLKQQIQSNSPGSVQKMPYFLKIGTKYLPNIPAVPTVFFFFFHFSPVLNLLHFSTVQFF